jgi:phosphatidylinositol glycan class S
MALDPIEEHSHEDDSSFEEREEQIVKRLREGAGHHGFKSVIYYIAVFIAIGVPLWYKTTTPVRYPVPDVANLMVHTQMMIHKTNVEVVFLEDNEELLRSTASSLRSKWPRNVSPDGSSSFVFAWNVYLAKTHTALLNIFAESVGKTLQQIDEEIQADFSLLIPPGSIRVFVVWRSLLSSVKVAYGNYRSIYVSNTLEGNEILEEVIASAVLTVLEAKKDETGISNVKQEESSLIVDPNINFFINIVLEESYDARSLKTSGKLGDIHSLVGDAVLKESGLSEFLNIEATTRMVYYAIDDRVMDSLVSKDTTTERQINVRDIPLLINSIESRIVDSDTNSSFNLNVIIPSSNRLPLYFVRSETNQGDKTKVSTYADSKSNVLMTSSKTGFIVWNKEDDFNLGLKVFMRRVLDMSQTLPNDVVTKDIFFPLWELDALQRRICQRQLLRSLSSLESIEKLLGKVGNIVIKKEVSDDMHLAVQLNHEALDHLAAGRLREAFESSSKAYSLSEKSFFDPSLLALLYFPEDQKYAVYFPLFLPVSLPISSSIYYMVMFYWKKRKSSK